MDDARERKLVQRAEKHHGVFSVADIADVGLDSRWRNNRVLQARIVAVHHAVYRFAGAPLSFEGQLLAAVWAGGPRGRASHRSAALLWGLAGGTQELIELTCHRWRRAQHAGMRVHETNAFEAIDHTEIDGIPVTTCARTLIDLGAVVPPNVVEMALDDALRKGLVTLLELRSQQRRLGRRGRNGAGVLRTILDERAPGSVAESRQERRMVQMLERNGLPTPVLQHEVRVNGSFVARVDAAYPEWRIAIEYESYEHHTGKAALERDTTRRHQLRRAGWDSVGVTAADLRNGATSVCATIRSIIEDRRTQLSLLASESTRT